MQGGFRTQTIRALHPDDPIPSEEERAHERAKLAARDKLNRAYVTGDDAGFAEALAELARLDVPAAATS